MPTFERCISCLIRGTAADEAPIVPEGTRCQRCHDAGQALKILATCAGHGYVAVCHECGCQVSEGGILGQDGHFRCDGCAWDRASDV